MKRSVPTLLLVPDSLLWEGLARLLSTTDYKPIRRSATLDELVRDAEFDPKQAMFVLGWDSGARTAGKTWLNDIRTIRERYPDSYVVVMSAVCDVDSVAASLQAGADGYILCSMTCEMLTKSFDLVMSGETVLPSEFTRAFCSAKLQRQNSPIAHLTPPSVNRTAAASDFYDRPNGGHEMRKLSGREMAIMSRLREGDSNKIIARRIGLAEATVKTHVKAILRKVGVKNRTQAALWAIANLGEASNGGSVMDAPAPAAAHDDRVEANGLGAVPLSRVRSGTGNGLALVRSGNGLGLRKLPRSAVRQRSRAAIE
ncbi:response regulator transcription factor [Hyphomicrobium sp.]|uniref:response regulator transcription factor n=1 Tax=Hyphomicrobium sp. TaxID=82 RepID=UPI0025BB21C7|nr:response regulator transcription factor [Hyphomicrobium sp.]MCC7250783.1 response regulator transcription factor [Hyphomicrobium sp.]